MGFLTLFDKYWLNILSFYNVFRTITNNRYKCHTQLKSKLTKYAENAFIIFHQNICGLPNKQEELLHSLTEHPQQIMFNRTSST